MMKNQESEFLSTLTPWGEPQVWYGLQPLTKEKQESVRKKEEEEDKHCHYEEWNMFALQIVNVGIIQPHFSVICWIFKVGDINCSNQCTKDLCIREEDEGCQDRNWVATKHVCKSAWEMKGWVILAPKDKLETQTAAMFCCKYPIHCRSMSQFQSQGLAMQWRLRLHW